MFIANINPNAIGCGIIAAVFVFSLRAGVFIAHLLGVFVLRWLTARILDNRIRYWHAYLLSLVATAGVWIGVYYGFWVRAGGACDLFLKLTVALVFPIFWVTAVCMCGLRGASGSFIGVKRALYISLPLTAVVFVAD
jgi:hypothetical protein